MGGEWDEVPEFVPARMVNEFAYCPRLFYLEWSSRQFEENEFTADGKWRHRAVDDEPVRNRQRTSKVEYAEESVTLSSVELGVIGKLDRVEFVGSKAVPVETKRGKVPTVRFQKWLPDEIQLCLQGLLLRATGYQCDHGFIHYAESHHRERVEFQGELEQETLSLLGDVRKIAVATTPPPPLVDSPKCNGCSLVGICLPDETNNLRTKAEMPQRQLVPHDSAARPLYVTRAGARVGKSGGRVQIQVDRETVATERLIDVSQVCVFGNVQVSTQLLRDLFSREIPVCYFSTGGWFSGIASGMPSKNVGLRLAQFKVFETESALAIAREMIAGKIANSRTLLMRNGRPRGAAAVALLRRLATSAQTAQTAPSLLGFEGTAARVYFSQFPNMLRPTEAGVASLGTFDFDGRNRRPPRDPVNCCLSFSYALLTKEVFAALIGVGFDPYVGFLHRPRFGRPALALDLAEEFRPLVAESVVMTAINTGEVVRKHFICNSSGVGLTQDGRRTLIGAFERRMEQIIRHPVFGYQISYRRAIEVQARMLAAHVMGEIPAYRPMLTR